MSEDHTGLLCEHGNRGFQVQGSVPPTEDLLRLIAENIPDALYIIDPDSGEYSYVNPAFEKVTGYTLDDIREAGGREAFENRTRDKCPDEFLEPQSDATIAEGDARRCEAWWRRKDGTLVCLEDRSIPVPEGSRECGKGGLLRDITPRKKQELTLRQSHLLLRTIVTNIPDALYAKDSRGRKILANPTDVHNIGYTSEDEILGKDDFALFPYEIAQAFFADDQSVISSGEPVLNREEFYFDVDGKKHWLLTTKIPMRNANGEVTGLVGIGHDITIRKQAEEELRLFRMLVDRSSDAIEVLDPQTGKFIDANEAALKSLGYSRDEFLSLSVFDIDPAIDAEQFKAIAQELKEKGNALLKRIHRRKDGSEFSVEVSFSHVYLDRDYVVSVVRDTSRRTEAEAALKQSEDRFRLISENVADLMTILDPSGVCMYASPSHMQEGIRPESLVGGSYLDHIHPDDIEGVKDRLDHVINGQGQESVQFRFRRGDGSWRYKDANITLLVDDEGLRLLALARDITDRILQDEERLTLEMKLCERNATLEKTIAEVRQMQQGLIQSEKMASIGQLTAGIAHEINNPLAFVSSNLNRFKEYFESVLGILRSWDVIKKELQSEPRFQAHLVEMEQIEKQADLDFVVDDFGVLMNHTADGTERIRSIVDRLRGFSHMAANSNEAADINAAIDDTINLTWNELKYKATIVKEYGEIPTVKCNIGEIKQVLVNLLVNAAHALPEKGTITLKTYVSDAHAVIQIQDTGIGIPEAHLKRIFDPFFTTKPVGKGTGLGLWISATIIQKHKGTLTALSVPGKGTTMTIKIPLEPDVQKEGE